MDFSKNYTPKRSLLMKPSGEKINTEPQDKVAHCINELLLASVSFQRLHLKVKNEGSYAAHTALGELYESLPEIADTIAECYQGATEMCLDWQQEEKSCPKILNSVEEAVYYIRELYERVKMMQDYITFSEISNELDNLKILLNKTKYKLLFLK